VARFCIDSKKFLMTSNLQQLLSTMQPVLQAGKFAYCCVPKDADLSGLTPIASVLEAEGLTLILPLEQARARRLSVHFECAWITLTVHSDLAACGLTAAFASALAAANISCNVLAGTYHDHLLVPIDQTEQALHCLRELSDKSRRSGGTADKSRRSGGTADKSRRSGGTADKSLQLGGTADTSQAARSALDPNQR
jgi:uncharacterized protein